MSGSESSTDPRKQSYHFSRKQFEYLMEDNAGDSSSTYRSRTAERIRRLPARFDILFEDMEAVQRAQSGLGGDLDLDAWLDARLGLLDLDASATHEEVIEAVSYSPERLSGSSVAEFGRQLGETARRLMLYPDMVEPEEVWAELLWGFLKGVCLSHRQAGDVSADTLRTVTDDMTERLNQRVDPTAEEWETTKANLTNLMERGTRGEETQDRIRVLLEQRGIDPTPWLVSEVHWHVREHYREIGKADVFGLTDQSPRDLVTAELVGQIVEEHRLHEGAALMDSLDTDLERIQDKTWRGPSAADVLEIVFEFNEEGTQPRSEDVNKRLNEHLGSEKRYTDKITRIGKDLAGVDCEHRDETATWDGDDSPLLRGDRNGWETTAYGNALVHHLRHARDPASAFKRGPIAMRAEILTKAVDEVGTE